MPSTEREAGTARASLELLYHISRELAMALDLDTILPRVLSLSIQAVKATSGSIVVVDDAGRPVESILVSGEKIYEKATPRLRVPLERGLAGWVVRNRQAVLVSNTSQDEHWIERRYEQQEQFGPKSAVSAPLLVREKLVGVITLVHPIPGTFTNDHLELIQAIADQAGFAVLNARLFEESQRQARVMSALAESAAAITASLNLEDVLERILDQVSHALRAQTVSLALIDAEKGELVFRAATGWAFRNKTAPNIKIGQGIAGWVAREGRGVIVPDVRVDPRFDRQTNIRTGFETRSIACAPIPYRGQVIGVLEATNPTNGEFDPDALLLLTGIGSLAGSAIHHAQLYERLHAAHQSYKELFEDSIDPILLTDWDGSILEANRQAVSMALCEKENLLRMGIQNLGVINLTKLGDDFESLADGEMLSYEANLRAQSGFEVPVQVYVRQVKLDGRSHLQWILRDITERKKLDTQREDLLSMIYHDLRSPLANVVSSLDVIYSMISDDPTLNTLLRIATRSTERIQRLTNSLLDINRLEAGQPVGNLQVTQLALLIDDVLEVAIPGAESKGQAIVGDIPEDMTPVLIEPEMIRRVLTNLVENAIKFTPQNGMITIGGQQEGDWVRLWVKDNGPGIAPVEQKRIFEKFARVNSENSPKGLGLGLAYCRMAVEAHGGRIWVESEPGTGACFNFTLPVATDVGITSPPGLPD